MLYLDGNSEDWLSCIHALLIAIDRNPENRQVIRILISFIFSYFLHTFNSFFSYWYMYCQITRKSAKYWQVIDTLFSGNFVLASMTQCSMYESSLSLVSITAVVDFLNSVVDIFVVL